MQSETTTPLDELPDETRSAVFGDEPPTLTLVAPAKINLFLRITKKRDDGFHELASLFQTVSLFDTLDFWENPDPDAPLCSMEVTPNSLGYELIPTDESNLVMRALQLFANRTGVPPTSAVVSGGTRFTRRASRFRSHELPRAL